MRKEVLKELEALCLQLDGMDAVLRDLAIEVPWPMSESLIPARSLVQDASYQVASVHKRVVEFKQAQDNS